jgi:flagellar hook-basal body complex protein FliE
MNIQPITSHNSMVEVAQALQNQSQIQSQNVEGTRKVDFAEVLESAVKSIDNQQHESSMRAAAVETGKSDDLVGAMIASQKAGLSFTLLVQSRNKIVSGFEEFMRMPV